MRTTSVRLVTLCGCQKFMVVPGSPPDVIDVPIKATMMPHPSEATETTVLRHRRFRLHRLSPDDVSVEADYHEVAES